MTHASFPYASPWQVIRQSHNSCSARWLMHTFKYISIYSSFIISTFKTVVAFLCHRLPYFSSTCKEKNLFVSYFYQSACYAPEINPDDVTRSIWECMSCDLEFQMWSYKLQFIFDGVIEHEFFTHPREAGGEDLCGLYSFHSAFQGSAAWRHTGACTETYPHTHTHTHTHSS